ncbi:MAG: hypothetical protein ACLU9T_07065 [Blautia faecis]
MAGSAAVAGHAAKTRKKKESQFSLVMKVSVKTSWPWPVWSLFLYYLP